MSQEPELTPQELMEAYFLLEVDETILWETGEGQVWVC
jgi:hypothetical protein